MKRNTSTSVVFGMLILFALISGIFGIFVGTQNYELVRDALNYLAPDGNLEVFSESIFFQVRQAAIIVGIVGSLIFVLAILFSHRMYRGIEKIIEKGLAFLGQFSNDSKRFSKDLKANLSSRSEWSILLGLMALAVFIRIIFSDAPMGHDESYTFLAFSARSFKVIFTDYHLPNNHVFHSFLVRISYLIFGSAPWAVRLPAILASIFAIPISFLVGKSYFNRNVGFVSAAFLSISPGFLQFSVSARGYVLQALFALMLWLAAIYIIRHRNLFGWFVFITISTLSMFTIPTSLYLIGMIYAWLFLSWLIGETDSHYRKTEFFKFLLISGIFAIAAVLILYTPIFVYTGFNSIFGNNVISEMRDATFNLFFENFSARGIIAWESWHLGLPSFSKWVSLFGVVWGLIIHRTQSKFRVNMLVFGILLIFSLLAIQRTMGWVRVWFFLLPIYFLFAFAGLVDIFNRLRFKKLRLNKSQGEIILVLSIFLSAGIWMSSDTGVIRHLRGEPSRVETATVFLLDRLDQDDLIVAVYADAPALRFYGLQYGISLDQYDVRNAPFETVYVVVSAWASQTLQGVIEDRGGLDNIQGIDDPILIYDQSGIEIYQLTWD